MTRDDLIEKAAKAISYVRWNHALSHASRGAGPVPASDLARAALAVFEESLAPTGDDREALARVITKRIYGMDGIAADIADAILEAGFRRSEVPEPSAENARPGFFPNGQCRHYQLADGWAKIWCIRTEDGHTEHETAGGVRWASEAASKPQGEPSQGAIRAAVEADRQRIRSTIGAFVDEGVWAFDAAVSTLEKHDAALRAAAAVRGTGGEQ